MTHSQEQGAESVGRKAVFKPGDLVRNARYDHRGAYPAFGESAYVQAIDGDYLDFGQGAKLLDSLFDLASPRTDSAERAAGEVRAWPASYQETFNAIAAATKIQAGMISVSVRDFYRALSYPDRPATPAPATPPGVPDSLRALSEAVVSAVAEQKRAGDLYNAAARRAERTFEDLTEVYETFECAGNKLQQAKDALADACVALLTTHPAGQSEDAEPCIACGEPLKAGERVLSDASGGTIHAACCGPERESYTKGDGEPLGPHDPIPQGYIYEADRPAGQSAGSGADLTEPHAVFLAMHAGQIAKPTLDRLVQIYGPDTLRAYLARLGPETDLAATARSRGEWGLKGGHDTEGTSKLLIDIADRLSSAPNSPRTAEALVERLARDLAREGGWNDPDAPWTENQVIIARGGAGEPVWRDFVDGARSLLGRETFTSLLAAHQQVTAERDAYALVLSDCAATLAQVPVSLLPGRVDMMLFSALEAPLPSGVGRDEVIAAANRIKSSVTAERDEARAIIEGLARDLAKDRAELARLRAEGEAKDRALLLLLPFVDYAAGEGLAFVETEDGEHPEMDAADIMAATAEALGLELGSDAYLALLPAGYDAIRAARAATAREGA